MRAVRVTGCAFREDRRYVSATEIQKKPEYAFCPIPCATVDDLYLPPARATLARLLGDWLNHHCLTVTEFIHSASTVEKFEATGMLYQHAIQRMAVAQAAKSPTPVVQIVRALNDLATAAVNRIDGDERRGLFPIADAAALAELAERLAGKPNARYILNGSLAKHLAAAATWHEKLFQVLSLRAGAPNGAQSRPLFLDVVDTIVAEIVGNKDVLTELLGAELDAGQRLMTAVRVFQGDVGTDLIGLGAGLELLAQHFARDELGEARFAVADFILLECKGTNRLCPSSFADELNAFRQLVDKLNAMKTGYLNPEDLNAALVGRSKRFVTQEALSQILAPAQTPDEKLECLLMIADIIKGEANKRVLAPIVLAVLGAPNLKEVFAPASPGILRIKRAADLQKRVLGSSFAEGQRSKMADLLDDVAVGIEAKGGFFDGLTARMPDPAERVDTYMRMFATGIFTEGKLARKAQQALLAALAVPGFLAKYTAGKDTDSKIVVADLIARLTRVGLSARDCSQALRL